MHDKLERIWKQAVMAFAWLDGGNPRNMSLMLADVPAEIRTKPIPTKQAR
jgi:hypothetical protein